MAKRNSEYERRERDAYQTPAWVTWALIDELRPRGLLRPRRFVWEPAAGEGQMAAVLRDAGLTVFASDIVPEGAETKRGNFLTDVDNVQAVRPLLDAVITNPPYKDAEEFIIRALDVAEPRNGLVAMLLPVDFDSAKGRVDLFANCPAFGLKIVLTDRITWFEPELPPPGKDVATPSESHAWFCWDWGLRLGRSLAYRGAPERVLAELSAKRSAIRKQVRERDAVTASQGAAA